MIKVKVQYGDKQFSLAFEDVERALISRQAEYMIKDQFLCALAHLSDINHTNLQALIKLERFVSKLIYENRVTFDEAKEMLQ